MSQPVTATQRGYQFGTFTGVFTPSILTILGVVMYLRLGWVLGNVGITGTIVIVTLASSITFVTGLSLAVLATNMRVGRGGAYYIISRSLGVEVGAAVGLPLYLAQALGIAFYVAGFAEAFTAVVPHWPAKLVGVVTLCALALLSALSASLALRAQYLVMALIALSLVSFFAGGPPAGAATAAATLPAPVPFWAVFAVFFPAVTGIEAGIAMSGDLKNPGRSLPLGTIAAVLVGFLTYVAIPLFLLRTVPDRAALVGDPLIMERVARWGDLVVAGVWAAAVSSALGSLLGAPRTLQALAEDRVIPRAAARGFGRGRNPLYAIAVTFVIALAGVLLGGINAIAPVLSMFFLTSYGILNLSAGLGELISSPSWRPKFRLPALLHLAGFLGCLATMLMINVLATLVALLVSVAVYALVARRALRVRWGDLRYGALMLGAFQTATRMAALRPDEKSWRPNILVLTGSPAGRWYLVELADAISQGRSFMTLVTLIPEADWTAERAENINAAEGGFLAKRGVQAFVRTFAADDPLVGAQQIVRLYGFGPFVPNTILLGETEKEANHLEFARFIQLVHRRRRNLIVVRERRRAAAGDRDNAERRQLAEEERLRERIDVWWRGDSRNMNFILALLVLLRRGPAWRGAHLRLKVIVDDQKEEAEAAQLLEDYVREQRLHAEADIILRQGRNLDDIIRDSSQGADLVFLGLRMPAPDEEPEQYADYYRAILERTEDLPPTVLVMASEHVDFQRVFRAEEAFL